MLLSVLIVLGLLVVLLSTPYLLLRNVIQQVDITGANRIRRNELIH